MGPTGLLNDPTLFCFPLMSIGFAFRLADTIARINRTIGNPSLEIRQPVSGSFSLGGMLNRNQHAALPARAGSASDRPA